MLLQIGGQRHQRIVLLVLRLRQMLMVVERIEQRLQHTHVGHDQRVDALQIERWVQGRYQIHLEIVHLLFRHILAARGVLIRAATAAVGATDKGRGMEVLHPDGVHQTDLVQQVEPLALLHAVRGLHNQRAIVVHNLWEKRRK